MNHARLGALTSITVSILGLAAASAAWWHGSGVNGFMPHAHCYLFNRDLMLLHGGADLLIGLSYLAISATLTYLVFRSRKELPFHWVMLAFAIFIVACGATHFMELWTLQAPHPRYWLSGWVKVVTAIASLTTALILPPLVPKIRAVLESARSADARKKEVEKAYAELSELYAQAVAARSEREGPPVDDPEKDASAHDLVEMAKDVTVHARELERARHAAEEANRAKDHFLAVLSHELRTPLTPALAAASNLEHAAELDPEELRAALALIRRNIELEARLVDDLLDITRISKGKLEVHLSAVDLHEPIRHAAEMCQSAAHRKGTVVSLDLAAGDHCVSGDRARLAQVFWNLILNALKFGPAAGRIHIRTTNPSPGSVSVEVTDHGIGISPENLGQIFEPFQQEESSTARLYGGVGLGLSIAKGLIDAHGGSITARSEGKNQGATFLVNLATIVAPPAAPMPEGSTAARPPLLSLRILLVEDHPDTSEALTRLLRRWGHVVQPVGSVAQALQTAPGFDPEMLLSDIGLPDGTGMELLVKLRKILNIPAIAMSGYGMESDLQQTREAGFSTHLVKPVGAERLKESIDRLFQHAPSS